MSLVKLHPSIDKSNQKGAAGFSGGTLRCHCDKDKVEKSR